MEKPVLVVMAAGMGSRYGGLKQVDPVGENGQTIIDYSVYDAYKAGFETVIFIIKKEIEKIFKEKIGNKIAKNMNVKYAYQELDDLPNGYEIPKGRTKPWGTSHAILSARDLIVGSFAVINADDYYGTTAFKEIYDYLLNNTNEDDMYKYAMIGYKLKNTVTENGYVSRGICDKNEHGYLTKVVERTHIEKRSDKLCFTEDNEQTWEEINENSVVSMNMWGFTRSFIDETKMYFIEFLEDSLQNDPLKCEYYLPWVVSKLIDEKKAQVKVLKNDDKWYGVTYAQDKPIVVAAIKKKTDNGTYPTKLWKE